MRLWKLARLTGLTIFLAAASLGCTRPTNQQTLKLSFSRSAGTGSMSVSGTLEFAVVNVQLPTGPIVRQFEFHDTVAPSGSDVFTMEIPNVPRGSFLVQFFGVYKNPGSPSQFTYGDGIANVNSAESVVDILAVSLGTFGREGHIAGRYIDRTSPTEGGPTGTMVMQFQPPDLSKPPMVLQPFAIVDGWFNIMAVDGPELSYILNGQPIFTKVKISGTSLYMDGVQQTTSSSFMQIRKPASFAKRDAKVEGRPPTELFLGYIAKSGLVPAPATKKVCYPTGINEALRGEYAANLQTPIEITFPGTTAGTVQPVGGGTSYPSSQVYTNTASGCTESADNMLVYHSLLGGDENSLNGINPPFKAVAPFEPWDKWMTAKYWLNSSTPTITVSWKYLPGIDASAFDGAAILAKYSSTGDNGGGGDRTCSDLLSQTDPYKEVAVTASNSVTSYDFTGLPGLAIDNNNRYGWRIAVCPFKISALGKREWVGEFISGGSLQSYDLFHNGWANSSMTVTAGTGSLTQYGSSGGSIYKLVTVDAGTSPFYTVANMLSGPGNFQPNDEVMIHITGDYGTTASTPCGTRNGDPLHAGQFDFARVIAVSGSTLKLSKGSMLDSLDNTYLGGSANGNSDFCFVQIARVLHYRNLDLSAAFYFQNANGGGFNFSSADGLLPIRVNGTLTMGNASIHTNAAGYSGSSSPGYATGVRGAGGTPSTLTGGQYATGGGCGGGSVVAPGGVSTGCSAGSAYNGGTGFRNLLPGGGGGGASGALGGAGGGMVFLAAREIVVNGSGQIGASGAIGGVSTYSGGGGAGGTVMMVTKKVSGTGSLQLAAIGGDGGDAAAAGGAGGLVEAVACESTLTGGITATVVAGVNGTTPASPGVANLSVGSGGQMDYFCRSSD